MLGELKAYKEKAGTKDCLKDVKPIALWVNLAHPTLWNEFFGLRVVMLVILKFLLPRRHADIFPRATVRYSEKMQLVHQMAVLRRINEMKWTLGY